jgi:hypothetical protein
MNWLIAMVFGAGVAGFAYTKLGQRVGYGDQKSVWTIVGAVFVLTSAIFFTILTFIIPKN